MPNEALPNKREVMLALLAETSVFVHLDPRGSAVRVPPWFKNQPQLVLQIGLNMAVQIPDLDVGEHGISCTLSFSRRPFFCSIPWGSIFGLVGDNGPGLVWPDDVPAEIAAQVQAQTQKAQVVKKPPVREPPRGRLRAVGSEPPAGERAAETPSGDGARPAPVPEPAPALAPAAAPVLVQAATSSAAEDVNATESAQTDAEQGMPNRKPAQSHRPAGSKRELPPYLRVVK
jgi:hypothetical protein